jgi:hypothetical protein
VWLVGLAGCVVAPIAKVRRCDTQWKGSVEGQARFIRKVTAFFSRLTIEWLRIALMFHGSPGSQRNWLAKRLFDLTN